MGDGNQVIGWRVRVAIDAVVTSKKLDSSGDDVTMLMNGRDLDCRENKSVKEEQSQEANLRQKGGRVWL